MCKAKLNSEDQTPELLSLGQSSTSATSDCRVQSLLVRPEVVSLLASDKTYKTHGNFFPLLMVSPQQCSVFRVVHPPSMHQTLGGVFFFSSRTQTEFAIVGKTPCAS